MADQPHVAHGFDDGSAEKGLPASGGLMAGDVFRQIIDIMNER